MSNENPKFQVVPTAWDGYLPTFQSALKWLLQNTTAEAEAKHTSDQREHFAQGGGKLPSTVPPLVDGARIVQKAFDLADFAAIEHYMRSKRSLPVSLPSLSALRDRLHSSPVEIHKAASELLPILSNLAATAVPNFGNFDESDARQDGVSYVLAEIAFLRTLPPAARINSLSGYTPKHPGAGTPSLAKLDWPELDAAHVADGQLARLCSEIDTLFNVIESEARSYR